MQIVCVENVDESFVVFTLWSSSFFCRYFGGQTVVSVCEREGRRGDTSELFPQEHLFSGALPVNE